MTEPVLKMAEPMPLSVYSGDAIAFTANVALPEGAAVTEASINYGDKKAKSACVNVLPMTVEGGRLSAELVAETVGTMYYYVSATVDGNRCLFPSEGTLRVDVVSADAKYLPDQLTISPGATVSEVGLNWITRADGLTGYVLLRKVGAADWAQTIPVSAPERVNVRGDRGTFTSFSVDLTGLEPDTEYEYRAATNDGTKDYFSPTYTFRTLPAGDAFSFIVVSDLQSTNEEGYLPYLYTYTGFVQETLQPNFVVNLGDLTEDDTMAQWSYLFGTLGELQATTLTAYTPGNHESKGDVIYSQFKGRTNLPQGVDDEMLAEMTGAFTVGDVCFVILCTEPYSGIDGTDAAADKVRYYEAQKEWAKSVFEASGCSRRIVLAHAGLVQKDPEATAFLEAMCEELHVDLFFNGHIHDYFRATVTGDGQKAEVGEATTFMTVSPLGEKFDDYGGEIDDLLGFQTGSSKDTRHYFAYVSVDAEGVTVTVYRRVSDKAVTKKNCTEYEVIDSVRLPAGQSAAEPAPVEAPTEAPAVPVEPAAEPPKAVEPAPATEAPAAAAAEPGSSGNAWLWIGVCVAAIAVIVVTPLLLKRRKKD